MSELRLRMSLCRMVYFLKPCLYHLLGDDIVVLSDVFVDNQIGDLVFNLVGYYVLVYSVENQSFEHF